MIFTHDTVTKNIDMCTLDTMHEYVKKKSSKSEQLVEKNINTVFRLFSNQSSSTYTTKLKTNI